MILFSLKKRGENSDWDHGLELTETVRRTSARAGSIVRWRERTGGSKLFSVSGLSLKDIRILSGLSGLSGLKISTCLKALNRLKIFTDLKTLRVPRALLLKVFPVLNWVSSVTGLMALRLRRASICNFLKSFPVHNQF